MAIDLTKTGFTYSLHADKNGEPDGTVDYKAEADNKPQNLYGRDTSSKEALETDLKAYTLAYIAGLKSEVPQIGDDLIVGTQQTATATEG